MADNNRPVWDNEFNSPWHEPDLAPAGSSYADNGRPKELLSDSRFRSDLREYFRDKGATFASDSEMIEAWHSDRNWADLNTLGTTQDLMNVHGMTEDQLARFRRLQQVWDRLPSFWQEGGRGADAVGDIAKGILLDPLNLIGFGAGGAVAKTAIRSGAQGALKRGLTRVAGAEAALNAGIAGGADVLIQQRNIHAGLQEEMSTSQLALSTGIGAVAGGAGGALFGLLPGLKAKRVAIEFYDAVAAGNAEQASRLGEHLIRKYRVDPNAVNRATHASPDAAQNESAAIANSIAEPTGNETFDDAKDHYTDLVESFEEKRTNGELSLDDVNDYEEALSIKAELEALGGLEEAKAKLNAEKALINSPEEGAASGRTEAEINEDIVRVERELAELAAASESPSSLEELARNRAAAKRPQQQEIQQAGQTQDANTERAQTTQQEAQTEAQKPRAEEPASEPEVRKVTLKDASQFLKRPQKALREQLTAEGIKPNSAEAKVRLGELVNETEQSVRENQTVEEWLENIGVDDELLEDLFNDGETTVTIREVMSEFIDSADIPDNAKAIAKEKIFAHIDFRNERVPVPEFESQGGIEEYADSFARRALNFFDQMTKQEDPEIASAARLIYERRVSNKVDLLKNAEVTPEESKALTQELITDARDLVREAREQSRVGREVDVVPAEGATSTDRASRTLEEGPVTAGTSKYRTEIDPATGEVSVKSQPQSFLRSGHKYTDADGAERSTIGRIPRAKGLDKARARIEMTGHTGVIPFRADQFTRAVDGVVKRNEEGFLDASTGKVYREIKNMPGWKGKVAKSLPNRNSVELLSKDPISGQYINGVYWNQGDNRPSVRDVAQQTGRVMEFVFNPAPGEKATLKVSATGIKWKRLNKVTGEAVDKDDYLDEGLTSHIPNKQSTKKTIRAQQTAFYDPATDTIYASDNDVPAFKGDGAATDPEVQTKRDAIKAAFKSGEPARAARVASESYESNTKKAETTEANTTTDAASEASTSSSGWPEGLVPAIRDKKKKSVVRVPNQDQTAAHAGQTGDFFRQNVLIKDTKKTNPDDWEVGYVTKGAKSGSVQARDTFVLESEVAQEGFSPRALTSSAPEPSSLAPTLEDLAKIELDIDGVKTNALKVYHRAIELEGQDLPRTAEEFDEMRALLQRAYSLLPNEIRLPRQERSEAMAELINLFDGEPPEIVWSIYDSIRRLQGDQNQKPKLTAIESETKGGSYNAETNTIGINTKGTAVAPVITSFHHEIGHWGYFNLLTPKDRLEFLDALKTKIYDAEGNLNQEALNGLVPHVDGVSTNWTDNANEIFATQFSLFMSDKSPAVSASVDVFRKTFEKFAHIIEKMIELFYHPQKKMVIDEDFAPYFRKIVVEDEDAQRWYNKDYGDPKEYKNKAQAESTLQNMSQVQYMVERLERALNRMDLDMESGQNELREINAEFYQKLRNSGWLMGYSKNGTVRKVSNAARVRSYIKQAYNINRAIYAKLKEESNDLTELAEGKAAEKFSQGESDESVEAMLDRYNQILESEGLSEELDADDFLGIANSYDDDADALASGFEIIDTLNFKTTDVDDVTNLSNWQRLGNTLHDSLLKYHTELEQVFKRQSGFTPAVGGALKINRSYKSRIYSEKARLEKGEPDAVQRAVDRTKKRAAEKASKKAKADSKAEATTKQPRSRNKSRNAAAQRQPNYSKLSPDELTRQIIEAEPNTQEAWDLAQELIDRNKASTKFKPTDEIPESISKIPTKDMNTALKKAITENNIDAVRQIFSELHNRRNKQMDLSGFLSTGTVRAIATERAAIEHGYQDIGVPINTSETTKGALLQIAHKDPGVVFDSRRLFHRLTSIAGVGKKDLTDSFVARLAGQETGGPDSIFVEYTSPDFKKARSEVRRLAQNMRSLSNTEDTRRTFEGDANNTQKLARQVYHDAVVLTSRVSLSDKERDQLHQIKRLSAQQGFKTPASLEEWLAQKMDDVFDLLPGKEGGDPLSDIPSQFRYKFLNTAKRLNDDVALLTHRIVDNDVLSQAYPSLNVYGDMTIDSRFHKNLASIDHRPEMSAKSYAKKAFKNLSKRALAKFRRYHTEYNPDGSPILYYHATPRRDLFEGDDGSLFTFRPTGAEGSGLRGPGVYISSEPDLAHVSFGVSLTPEAINSLVSDLPPELAEHGRVILSRMNNTRFELNDIQHKMEALRREGVFDELEMANLEADGTKLINQLGDLEDYARQFGYEPTLLPVAVHSPRNFDFRHSTSYKIKDLSAESGSSAYEFIQKVARKVGLEDADIPTAIEDFMAYRNGKSDYINGDDLYEGVVDMVIRTQDAYNKKSAPDLLTEALQDLGYTGIKARDVNGKRAGGGDYVYHDVMVLFEDKADDFDIQNPDIGIGSHQVKHLTDATAYDYDSPLFFDSSGSLTGNTPATPTGSILMNALNDPAAEYNAAKASPFLSEAAANGAPPGVVNFMRNMFRGRPGSREIETAEKFNALLQIRTNASRMRISGSSYVADWIKPEDGPGHFEAHNEVTARNLQPVLKALNSLPDTSNAIKEWLRKSSNTLRPKGAPSPESHKRIYNAILRGTHTRLSDPSERVAANVIQTTLERLRNEMDNNGISIGYINNYLPQVYNVDAIRENYDKFTDGLTRFLINDDISRNGKRTRPDEKAREIAELTVDRILGEDGLIDDGVGSAGRSRAPITNQERQRLLNFTPDQLDEYGIREFLVDDLTGLMTQYVDSASRRIEFQKKFGTSNHGFYDWMEVVAGGQDRAFDLLTSRKVRTEQYRSQDDLYQKTQKQLTEIAPMPEEQATLALREAKQAIAGGADARQVRDIILSHHTGRGNRVAFRKRADAIAHGLLQLHTHGRMHRKEVDFHDHAFRAIQRKRVYNGYAADNATLASRYMRNFNAVTLLSFTTLTSTTDLILPAIRSGQLGASLRGLKNYASDPEYRDMIRNIGVSMENFVHERHAMLFGAGGGRMINGFFNATGLTPWTNTMRELAAVQGHESFRAMERKAQKAYQPGAAKQSAAFHRARRFLRRYGLEDFAYPGKTIDDGTVSGLTPRLSKAIIAFTNDTIFTPNPNDIPVWAQTPIGALVMQLKSFPLMMGRMSKHVLSEAFGRETLPDGSKVWKANLGPLAILLSLGAGFGAGSLALKDVVQMRSDPDEDEGAFRTRTLSKLLGEFGVDVNVDNEIGFMGTSVPVDDFVGWYLEGALMMGGLGMVGELLYNSAAQLDNGVWGQQRMASYMMGPSYGAATDAANAIAGGVDALTNPDSNSKERSGLRSVVGRVPVVGQIKAARDGIVDAVAGKKDDGSGGFGGGFGGFEGF